MIESFVIAMSPPPDGSGGGGSLVSTLIMFGLIIGIFYLMILRPQQKKQKDRQKLLDSVRKGDKVITAGGMHGSVAGLDEKTVLLQVGDNIKMKFERSAITSIIRETEPETKETK